MVKQPQSLEDIPEISPGSHGLFINKYFFNVLGAAKLILRTGQEKIVYVGSRTSTGKLICSHTAHYSATHPQQKIIGSETEWIDVQNIKEYHPIRGRV